MEIIKAIIPAAGLGTRFLPFTKAIPKELIPLLDKPAMQYVIEEAQQSGVNAFCVVTGRRKQAISDYFDSSLELEMLLREKHKENLTASIDKISRTAEFSYVRQQEQLGLGHAVLMARHFIGKEYFSVLLPDDIIVGQEPGLAQLLRVARQEKGSVIAVQEVSAQSISNYGVVAIKKRITQNLFQLSHIVEKPDFKDAPSNLAVVGRYILPYKIFSSLQEISSGAVNELQLTDAISHMMRSGEKVFAYKIQGQRYDVGAPLGWIKALIGMGLQHPEYGPHIQKMLSEIETTNSVVFNKSRAVEHTL
jgi:UTP--glucose-1-phosphate uridylyltransferase